MFTRLICLIVKFLRKQLKAWLFFRPRVKCKRVTICLLRSKALLIFIYLFFIYLVFPLPRNRRIQDVSKIRTVKEEMERAKYSRPIICPLSNYICLG